jgi:hypothetical protein
MACDPVLMKPSTGVNLTQLYLFFALLVLFVGNEDQLSLCAKQQTVQGESQLFRVPGGKDLMSKITVSVKNEGGGQYQVAGSPSRAFFLEGHPFWKRTYVVYSPFTLTYP